MANAQRGNGPGLFAAGLAFMLALVVAACSRGTEAGPRPSPNGADKVETPLLLALDENPTEAADGAVSLFDPAAQEVVARFLTGYTPDAAHRSSAGTLLVSQAFGPPGVAPDEPTLTVFDVDRPDAPAGLIPISGSGSYKVYSPRMLLSQDQRYLYYYSHRWLCPGGGDAGVCDELSIRSIDLDTGEQAGAAVVGIGYGATLLPVAGSETYVLATDTSYGRSSRPVTVDAVTLLRLSPGGEKEELASFPAIRTPDWIIGAVAFGRTQEHGYFVLYNDGSIVFEDNTTPSMDLLLGELRSDFRPIVSDNDIMVLFGGDEAVTGVFAGLLLVPRDSPWVARRIEPGFAMTSAARVGDERVAVLHAEGERISVIDTATGAIVDEMAAPAGTDLLIGR